MELLAHLKFRATQSLDNPSEITGQVLELALAQSDEICKNKDVPTFARIDIAYIRLKIYLKIELNGEDELLLKNALEVVKNVPFIDEKGAKSPSACYAAQSRESEFC